MSKRDLSQQEAKRVFKYNLETGLLFWKVNIGQRARVGNIAGSLFKQPKRKTDYWNVKLNGKNYLAHRVIWTMNNGDIPEGIEIDHKDGNGLNNRLSNLRLANHSQQNKNQPMRADNKSGYVGVHKLVNGNYTSYINSGGKRIHLGTHICKEDAAKIRKYYEKKYCFHENHGR